MPATFNVSDVPVDGGLQPTTSARDIIRALTRGELEAAVDLPCGVIGTEEHPFLGAVRLAFAEHLPLVLRPDDVWLLLVQGLSQHVQLDPERLRSRLVNHSGVLDLVVIRNDFRRGNPDNDWPGVFPEMGARIREHVGKRHDLIVAELSTTGDLDRVAANLALMDIMQSYFTYTVVTRCGIPTITLEGTVDDWVSVRERARVFAEFDLGWWAAALEPVLSAFVDAAAGAADRDLWRSFYKWNSESGGPFVSGWINALFPYIRGDGDGEPVIRNDYAADWRTPGWGDGPRSNAFPTGLRSMPFTWDYVGTKLPMRFHGGFIGVRQDPTTLAVSPQLGWAVEHRDDSA